MTIYYNISSPSDEPPSLDIDIPVVRSTGNDLRRLRRNNYINIVDIEKKMSSTSDARECYVNRRNSKKFQQFMFNYAYTIVKSDILSGEI